VFDIHDWDDVAEQLSSLSKEQRWNEMEAFVTDEMVNTIAVVAPHERLAEAVRERYGGLCTKVEFSIPVENPGDHELLRDMIGVIRSTGPAT
jgi:hypothetical protein